MKFPIAGPAYQHPSQDVNNQRCVNMFTMTPGPEGRGKLTLMRTGGLSLLTDLNGFKVRQLKTFGAYTYAVVDNHVYRLSINSTTLAVTTVDLGTITTSTGPVGMAANPTQIIIVDGTTTGYIIDIGAGTMAAIADADYPGGDSVVFNDGYFVVNQHGTGKFFTSALNDGTSWDPTDVATAESSTDNIVALGVVKGELWILGQQSIEIWYDNANASGSPYSNRLGLGIQIGCGAIDSVTQLNDLLVFLDNRGFIVQSDIAPFVRDTNSGYALTIISTEALTAEILSYSTTSDAVGMSYSYRGHLMYQITFPTAKKTWVYDYTAKLWHERSYHYTNGSFQEDREHLGQYYCQSGQLHLMGGLRSGKIYLVSPTYYTDDGVDIRCVRTVAPIENEFDLISINRVELRLQTGAASTTGSGSDPHIGLRYSLNGGHTWENQLSASMGLIGEYNKSVSWNRLGAGREWVFEFSITEPINFSIIDGSIDIDETGT